MKPDSIVTVIKAATTQDLTTLEAAKDELNITGSDQDRRIARWITETSRYIARWCNRTLALETVSEQWRAPDFRGHHGFGQWHGLGGHHHTLMEPSPLVARRWPIADVTSIIEDDCDTALDPTTDFEVDAANGRIWRLLDDIRGPWYTMKVVANYSGGFDVPRAVPPDLQQACLMLLQIRANTNTRDRMLRSQVIPGVLEEQYWNPNTTGTAAMPPEIADVLIPYREPPL